MILDRVTTPGFEAGLERSRTVLLPFGSIEEHGRHLPLGTDTMQVVEVCRRAAERTGAHVAPALPYGVCRSTSEHPGTVGITAPTLRAVAGDLLRDFYRQGMRAFVLISGHAGTTHLATLVDAGEALLRELPEARIAVVSEYREACAAGRDVIETADDSHAGEVETSRIMALDPSLVDGTSPEEYPAFPDCRLVRDKRAHWPGGVWGDPSRASAEKGRTLFERAATRLVEIITTLETEAD